MWEPPEASDDVAMFLGPRQIWPPETAIEFDGAVLVRQILRMAERKVKEEPQVRRDRQIMASADSGRCYVPGYCVASPSYSRGSFFEAGERGVKV
jgi:hypothetical protein